jgi:hypothetical protein
MPSEYASKRRHRWPGSRGLPLRFQPTASAYPLRVALLPEFNETTGALSAFQNVQVFGVGEIELQREVDPRLQSRVSDPTDPFRIGMSFEDVLLELLEKQRVIVIILEKRLTDATSPQDSELP